MTLLSTEEQAKLEGKRRRDGTVITEEVQASREAEQAQPGDGYMLVPGATLLRILGFKPSAAVEVTGVRWSSRTQELKVTVRSTAIDWRGGRIIQTDPVRTDKQLG